MSPFLYSTDRIADTSARESSSITQQAKDDESPQPRSGLSKISEKTDDVWKCINVSKQAIKVQTSLPVSFESFSRQHRVQAELLQRRLRLGVSLFTTVILILILDQFLHLMLGELLQLVLGLGADLLGSRSMARDEQQLCSSVIEHRDGIDRDELGREVLVEDGRELVSKGVGSAIRKSAFNELTLG